MYRDDVIALDEHDRAVGAILIGEALISQCEQAAAQIADPQQVAARWRAVRAIHEDYPEIWRQLDRAAQVLAARGANTMGYAELRPAIRAELATANDDLTATVDLDALDDARRAVGELKLAVPGADWKAIDRRTHALVELPYLGSQRRRHRLLATTVIGAFVGVIVAWFLAIAPSPPPDARAEMRREIAGIVVERKTEIARLGMSIEHRCDPPDAHLYTKLLAMDGRKDDARAFADRYAARCGEDRVVENWANAPRIRPR